MDFHSRDFPFSAEREAEIHHELFYDLEPGVSRVALREFRDGWYGFVAYHNAVDWGGNTFTVYGPAKSRDEASGLLARAGYWEPIGPEED